MSRSVAAHHLALLILYPLALAAAEAALPSNLRPLIEGHHWTAARPLLEQAVATQPQDAEAHYFLGLTLLHLNLPKEAVAALEKASALAPANSDYVRLLGDAYGNLAQTSGLFSKLGWARKCKAAYEQAIALNPRSLDARWSVLEYCLEAPGIAGGGIEEAYAQAAEIQKLDPAQGRSAFATLYVAEKKYSDAFALYEEVLRKSPADYDALYALGRMAALTGQHLNRGLACLQQCLTLPPHGPAQSHAATQSCIGSIREKQGQPAAARAAYEAALQLDPTFQEARDSLAKLK